MMPERPLVAGLTGPSCGARRRSSPPGNGIPASSSTSAPAFRRWNGARGGSLGGAGYRVLDVEMTWWSAVTPARCCHRPEPDTTRPTWRQPTRSSATADPADHRLRRAVRADVHERAADFRPRPGRPWAGHRAVLGRRWPGQLPRHLACTLEMLGTDLLGRSRPPGSTASRRRRWRCAAWSRCAACSTASSCGSWAWSGPPAASGLVRCGRGRRRDVARRRGEEGRLTRGISRP